MPRKSAQHGAHYRTSSHTRKAPRTSQRHTKPASSVQKPLSPLQGKKLQVPQRKGHPFLVFVACLIVALACVYGIGAAVFHVFFMPRTTLDGADVSWKSASEISSAYAARVTTYQTQVGGNDLSFTIRGSDIDFKFNEKEYERGTIGQENPWLWPVHILQTHDIQASSGATFDRDKLRQIIAPVVEKYNKNATQPVNATVSLDGASQQYVVVPEKNGTAIDMDKVVTDIADKLEGLPSRITLDSQIRVQPSVTKDNQQLVAAAQTANQYSTAHLTLNLATQKVGEITRSEITQWITVGDDLNITIDHDRLAEWVKNQVAKKYDTVSAERTYTRLDGKQVTVTDSGKGTYGWITDESALVDALTQAIESGSTESITIPTRQNAEIPPDAGRRDWGKRFIDIDLSEQHVRMYGDDGALLWESDCVTGSHSAGHDTPTGVYQLNSNRDSGDVELRGKLNPATNEPEYISHVKYWLPFIDNGWALHDASWRSSFGGSIYMTNGSHGCVNLPPDKAAELFNLTKVGDVVTVHN